MAAGTGDHRVHPRAQRDAWGGHARLGTCSAAARRSSDRIEHPVPGERTCQAAPRPCGLIEHYPWIVAFTFGLLHGFGFAGALGEVGLPENEIPLALLTFNVDVEIGQLLFVGAVLLALAASRRF